MSEPPKEVSVYEQLKAIDVIDPILEPFMQGKIIADIETKKLSLHRYMALNRTWIFATVCPKRKCAKWLGIYNKFYRILPPPCLNCWKIVYVPQSLTELMGIQKLQESMGLPAKCGTEARDYTSGLGGYKAFWYCPFEEGLAGGRRHFERIQKALVNKFGEALIADRLKRGLLYLKRGCTEYERDFGPSDRWEQYDFRAKFALLESVWEDPTEMEVEWSPMKYTNMKRWIEFAIAYGDPDALLYINGKHLGVPAVKYNASEHSNEQFNYVHSLNEQTKTHEGGSNANNTKGRKANLFRLKSK